MPNYTGPNLQREANFVAKFGLEAVLQGDQNFCYKLRTSLYLIQMAQVVCRKEQPNESMPHTHTHTHAHTHTHKHTHTHTRREIMGCDIDFPVHYPTRDLLGRTEPYNSRESLSSLVT